MEVLMLQDPAARDSMEQTEGRRNTRLARELQEVDRKCKQARTEPFADDMNLESSTVPTSSKRTSDDADLGDGREPSTMDHEEEISDLVKCVHDEYTAAVQAEGVKNPVCEDKSEVMNFYHEADCGYVDYVAGCHLDRTVVEEARRVELNFIDKMGVWQVVNR